MNKNLLLLLLLGVSLLLPNVWADGDREEEGEETVSRIKDQLSKEVGIITAKALPAHLNQTVSVFGKLRSIPEHTYQVHARFSGIIKSMNYSIGDTVNKNQLLAVIESDQSLETYKIFSPGSGLIIDRDGNAGESTDDRELFKIGNFDTLWVDFQVYPTQQSKVKAGQTVQIIVGENLVSAKIDQVLPASNKPFLIARANLNNKDNALSPGMLAKGKISTRILNIDLAVKKDAVQELGGRVGVFVKEGEVYEFNRLILGQSDDLYYEVIDGLEKGAEYVVKNSYLIKADILKSEAEDDD